MAFLKVIVNLPCWNLEFHLSWREWEHKSFLPHLSVVVSKLRWSIQSVDYHFIHGFRNLWTGHRYKKNKIKWKKYVSLSMGKNLPGSACSFSLVIFPLLPLKRHIGNSKPGLDLSWSFNALKDGGCGDPQIIPSDCIYVDTEAQRGQDSQSSHTASLW